jgi:preprotein translocase subunit SecE
MTALFRYFTDSWEELKRVTWLTRAQMIASTWLVVFLVIIFSIYVFVVDKIIAFFFGWMVSPH